MKLLHDPGVRDSMKRRIQALRPDSKPKWGRMTADQMLWHINVSLAEAAGEYAPARMRVPIPRGLLRWMLLNVPWPKGSRTRPDMEVGGQRHDFDAERSRTLRLIDQICDHELNAAWPDSASLGTMRGKHWSRLEAKHLEHHLTQFGV